MLARRATLSPPGNEYALTSFQLGLFRPRLPCVLTIGTYIAWQLVPTPAAPYVIGRLSDGEPLFSPLWKVGVAEEAERNI
jgi:hypothetical protein